MPSYPQSEPTVNRRDQIALVTITAVLLLLAGAGLGWLFFPGQLKQFAAPGQLYYHEDGFRQLALALTATRLRLLRLAIGALLLLGLGGWLAIRKQNPGAAWQQFSHAVGRIRRHWQRLPVGAQRSTLVVLALVLAARLYYLVAYPLSTDEIASFDYFVRQGPRVIFSYYPIPNNHLLYNLLAWPLSLTGLSPRLVMRLPGWVLGGIGFAITLELLSRVAGRQRALLVTLLVGLTPLNVYYGTVGRGYGLQLGMLQLGFFAVLELLRPASGYRQLAWTAFVLSSITGLLLVPSYAYPLAALLLALAVGFFQRKDWAALGSLALAGMAVGLITMMLYSPTGTISGWHQLFANRYVTSRPAAQFWPGFRPRLYEVAAELFVPSARVSGPLWLGLALLGGTISWRLSAGLRRQAALLAWVLVALPIGLLAAQRVFPLARVLLYVPWGACVWLVLAWPRGKSTGLARQWSLRLVGGCLAGLGLFRLYLQEPQLRGSQRETALVQQAYQWLGRAAQPGSLPPMVGLQAPIHELFFAHYLALAPKQSMHLVSYRTQLPGKPYDFIVLSRAAAAAGRRIPAPYVASYSDALVTIYAKPTARRQLAVAP